MPHLQLDTAWSYPVEVKRELARRFGEVYAETMQTSPDIVDVTIRELNGGVWRCGDEPRPAAVLSCDIRRGRPAEQRARLGAALFKVCEEVLGIDPLLFRVEFTQHAGDEIYAAIDIDGVVHTGFSPDWSPGEANTPLVEQLREANR
jgi:phenylpyruvate tautomerase PptA (4-oxalocrotonate tautomerase family)